jgi:asparagine synthase (glutamine-hydrolysing)
MCRQPQHITATTDWTDWKEAMCGITVVADAGSNRSQEVVLRMTAALKHRGPDVQGVVTLPDCHLGHARLSIIDLSTGTQPMAYAEDRYWITFNGEIYNYRTLRSDLQQIGHTFRTTSDTEVILASYAQWREPCLDRFRGMFAFALWDDEERCLFAARDILGEKPLYYAFSHRGGLLIASEIKALLSSGMIEPRIDPNAIDAYLAVGYIPPDRTIYSNVYSLPPGHYLKWSKSHLKIVPYWRPILHTRPITIEDSREQLRTLLSQAVTRQTVADVPVGAFLSGGLDSSTVVALMQMQSDRPVKTFSVGFGSYINELPYARSVAMQYETEHYEIDLGMPNIAEMLVLMADIYDEPLYDSSTIPTYLISKFASQHVKVILSGDGGDELFGGYTWTYPALVQSQKAVDSMALWIVLRSLSKLLRHRCKGLALYSAGCGLAARSPDMWRRQIMQHVYINQRDRRRLWGQRASEVDFYYPSDYYRPPDGVEGANRGFFYDLTSYLPGDILVKVDRAAMANSLETRAPFLDRDLVEFALSLPVNLKVDGWNTKIALQDACADYWPEELRGRQKQGFGSPIHAWAKSREVRDLMSDVFSKTSRLSRFLPGVKHRHGTGNLTEDWVLLVLGLWMERKGVAL